VLQAITTAVLVNGKMRDELLRVFTLQRVRYLNAAGECLPFGLGSLPPSATIERMLGRVDDLVQYGVGVLQTFSDRALLHGACQVDGMDLEHVETFVAELSAFG